MEVGVPKGCKTYMVDIDGTICTLVENGAYETTSPIKANIARINQLFDEGNKIIYWTARGSTTGIDWTELTKKQLDSWGVKYHELKMKKPFYDVWIDDKAVKAEDFFGKDKL
jgi:hypothetical protein